MSESCHNFTCGNHGVAGEQYDVAKHCRKCYGAARNADLAKSLNRPILFVPPSPARIPLPLKPPCKWEGAIVSTCTTCQAERGHERQCNHPTADRDKCTRGAENNTLQRCNVCPDWTSPHAVQTPAIPAEFGVAIGSYKWPSLVELQIKLIRSTCGPVPVLISSDDPVSSAAIAAICERHPDVAHEPNAERIGHTGGDVATFSKAARWGASRGMKVVAKLSQRFLVTRPNWLQDGVRDLLASGLAIATQRCTGSMRFDLRTEACLLDVRQWSTSAVLERIKPRRYWNDSPLGLSGETVIYRVLQDLLGDFFLPWSLFGEDRDAKYPGVVWHNSHSRQDYEVLAAEHGVKLDPDFHVYGWQQENERGQYLYG